MTQYRLKEKLIHKQVRDLVDNLPENRPALIDEAR